MAGIPCTAYVPDRTAPSGLALCRRPRPAGGGADPCPNAARHHPAACPKCGHQPFHDRARCPTCHPDRRKKGRRK